MSIWATPWISLQWPYVKSANTARRQIARMVPRDEHHRGFLGTGSVANRIFLLRRQVDYAPFWLRKDRSNERGRLASPAPPFSFYVLTVKKKNPPDEKSDGVTGLSAVAVDTSSPQHQR
jgi:hypothetical protein